VRNFAKATGILARTDAIDARVIAHFAQAVKPDVRPLKDCQTAENSRGAAEYGEAVPRFALDCTWQRWQRPDVIRPLRDSING
jgi:hypothetical protein